MTFNVDILIEELDKYSSPEISYIDTIAHIANEHNIEIEVMASIINRNKILKAKIYENSEKYRLVEKQDGFEFE